MNVSALSSKKLSLPVLILVFFGGYGCTDLQSSISRTPSRQSTEPSHAGDTLASYQTADSAVAPGAASTAGPASRRMDLSSPVSIPDLATGKTVPPDGEELGVMIRQETHDWFYGKGVGRTMLNVGAIVLFPPYAVYLLGNAGLQLAGVDPLYLSDALPEGARDGVNEAYDIVTSAPGRLNADLAGVEFKEE